MARIRSVKPEFFHDENLCQHPLPTRMTFQGLWLYADKAGRLEDRPAYLKAMIWPYDDIDINVCLSQLEGQFITRYTVDGKKYIQINNFLKHQRPHHTEKESEIPPFNGSLTVNSPSGNGEVPSGKEGKGKEGNGGGKGIKTRAGRFTPPSLEQVREYCLERKNGIDPEVFIDHYQARGWRYKTGQPMVDWKAAVRTWEKREQSRHKSRSEEVRDKVLNQFRQEGKL